MYRSAPLNVACRKAWKRHCSRPSSLSAIALLFSLVVALAAPPAAAEEYPICERSIKWPDECIIGGYRHYGEIYFSRPIRRGEAPSELPRGEQIADVSYDVWNSTYRLEEYFRRSRTTGMIVLKDGRIVFERYLLGADEHSLFTSQSVAKSFTSTLVGFAIGDGLIRSVDDPISDYVAELKGSGYEGVPIKAVLQMSSGVDWIEEYGVASSDNGRMVNESFVLNKTPVREFARNVKRSREPFAQFHYAGVDTVALGWLVSRVTGKTLTDYLSAKLWAPLGMEADGSWGTDGDGPAATEMTMCCLNATLRDYARFGLFMAQKGAWKGQQLLPPTWAAEATQPDRPQVAFGKLYSGYKLGYQYQWWAAPGPDHEFRAQGLRGQFIHVNPAENLVMVVTNAWPDFWNDTLEIHTDAVFEAFSAALRH